MNKIKVIEDMMVLRQLQREYLEFLDDEQKGNGKYHARTKAMIEQGQRRLVIDINDLRKKFPSRASGLLDYSSVEIGACQKALKEYVTMLDQKYASNFGEFLLGFEGNFGSNHLTPRFLTSFFLESLVCVEGIVTKCSVSKLKIVKSIHYCPTTGKFMERKYTDITAMDAFPSSIAYPTKDEQGNLLETEFGLSTYKDHQTLTIQEMPEKAPPGQLPRTVDVICDNDLVDLCKPGDRVKVIGCYKCLPGKHNAYTTGIFRTVIIANSILPFSPEEVYHIAKEDMNSFRAISRRKDIFDLMSNSIAPSIHGHDYIKKAILCMLLGGVERILPNGTRLRGDINILMIGDPGVAKSQLLRYVLQAAPRAIPTTGRGSSGVGLTAAVTTDPETGERRLEAGAMVLADRGVVCIDEFDKMSDMDRTAIHEVMEQGKVTISKAGIHARLNARCSVLAAANPVYGKYDQYKTPMQNIGLQDSLLSRFDLLFVLLDIVDTDDDKRIADHVVRMHRYRNPREQDGDVLPMGAPIEHIPDEKNDKEGDGNEDDDDDNDGDELVRKGIFEKYNPLLHGAHRSKKDKIFTMSFMKKYVHLCKTLKPVLTESAAQIIAEEYTRLRSQDSQNSDVARTQPITARTLETLIRLATARAKVRISRKVNADDARAAIELVQYAIFKKVLDKKDKKKRQRNEDDEMDVEMVDDEGLERGERAKRQKSVPGDEFDELSQEEQTPTLAELRERSRLRREKGYSISEEILKSFKDALVKIFMETRLDSMSLDQLMDFLSGKSLTFTREEVEAGLEVLHEQNHVMLSGNVIYLI